MRRIAAVALSLSASIALLACGGDDEHGVAQPASHTTSSSSAGAGGGQTGTWTTTTGAGGGYAGGGGQGGESSTCVALGGELQRLLDGSLKKTGAPGAVLSVSVPDCGTWSGATGASAAGVKVNPDDLVRIGSVTKTYVAATVMSLVGEGALSLDDPLEKHHPGFPNGAAIPLRLLMNHTSGVFNYTDDTDFQKSVNGNPHQKWAPQDLVDVAAKHDPYGAPGKVWHYSNTNYVLLGMIVEAVTKEPLEKAIRARALAKAKLSHTWFDGPETPVGTFAHGFTASPKVDVTSMFDPSWAWAAGAMVATSADAVAWADALYGGDVLSPDLLAAMLADPIETGQAGVTYGLGVFELAPSVALDQAYGHGGDIPGYHTQMWYLPNRRIGLAATVNEDGASPNPITAAVLEALVK
jgi:D-alanyl-D-alanine carboxypeptidase